MNIEIISVLAFLALIIILIYRDRKNIEFKQGLIIKRSKKGKEVIYRLAKKYENPLRVLGTIGVIISIIASFYGCYLLLNSTYRMIFGPEKIVESQIKFVLPTVKGVKLPGFILGVPFWFWIIGVFFVMFAHEPMHALLARVEGVAIKSFGLLLFIIIPGAFVDPDERQLKKLPTMKKLRIYAAGSFGNFILGTLLWLILLKVFTPAFYTTGVGFEYLNYTLFNRTEPFPAEQVGLNGTILKVNDISVSNIDDFSHILEGKKPGEIVKIETTEGVYEIELTTNPDNESKGFIGIGVYDVSVLKEKYRNNKFKSGIITQTTELLFWILFLNIGVGVFNLFPIKPLDGGLMFEEIVKHFFKDKKGEIIAKVVMIVTVFLVLFNIFGPSIIGLVKSFGV